MSVSKQLFCCRKSLFYPVCAPCHERQLSDKQQTDNCTNSKNNLCFSVKHWRTQISSTNPNVFLWVTNTSVVVTMSFCYIYWWCIVDMRWSACLHPLLLQVSDSYICLPEATTVHCLYVSVGVFRSELWCQLVNCLSLTVCWALELL